MKKHIYPLLMMMALAVVGCNNSPKQEAGTTGPVSNETVKETPTEAPTQVDLSQSDMVLLDNGKLYLYNSEQQVLTPYEAETDSVVNCVFVDEKLYYCVPEKEMIVLKSIRLDDPDAQPVKEADWGLPYEKCVTETYGTVSSLLYYADRHMLGLWHDFSWDSYSLTEQRLFNLDTHEAWATIYYIIGIATLAIGIIGWFLIEDAPGLKPVSEGLGETLAYSFRPSVAKNNRTLYLGLLNFAIFGISIQVFMPYLLIYYEKTLGMDNYVLIFAPAILLAAVFTVFYGRLYDSKGFVKSIVPAMLILMAGYVLLYFTKTTAPVFIGSLMMMAGYLSGMSVFGALIRDNIPEGRSGQFQGVRIIGQVFVPGLIGPALGAWILRDAQLITNSDGTTSFLPDRGIWLAAAIVLAVLLATLVLTFRRTKSGTTK